MARGPNVVDSRDDEILTGVEVTRQAGPFIDSVNKAYDDQVSTLFNTLCEDLKQLDEKSDNYDENADKLYMKFHDGVLFINKARLGTTQAFRKRFGK